MDFELTLAVAGATVPPVSVKVSATADATGTQLAEALRPLQPADGPLHLADAPLDDRPLAELGPLHGAVVWVGRPRRRPRVPTSGPRLHIETGPATGAVIAIDDDVEVGRGVDPGVSIPDQSLSRPHARLRRGPDGWSVTDLGSRNGTAAGGRGVGPRPLPVPAETPVVMGTTSVSVIEATADELAVLDEGDGTLAITRPMRNVPRAPEAVIHIPERPPDEEARRRFPVQWVALAVPLVMAAALVWITKRPQYALFAVMGPLTMMATTFTSRRSGKREASADLARYERLSTEAAEEERDAIRAELAYLRRVHPDPGEVTEVCVGPTGRVWERELEPGRDGERSDFLHLWVGTAAQPARSITLEGDGGRRHPTPVVPDAPTVIDLAEIGVLGVYGTQARTRAVARSLVLQAATLHGPDDLSIVVLPRDAAHRDWEWARWLPHCRNDDGSVAAAVDAETTTMRLKALATVIASRKKVRSGGDRSITFPTSYLVVVEDIGRLRSQAALQALLSGGPDVGIHTICVEDSRAKVTRECRAAVAADVDEATGRSQIHHRVGPPTEGVGLGALSAGMAERSARALAPLRVAEAPARDGDLLAGPVRLLDLLGLRDATSGAVRATWDAGGRTTRFLIGMTADGPLALDLALDGPHGLVAGTTGAGKSQLLMSIVASLAFANTPEDLNFVLIDFKGGGAFGPCQNLPHTTGMVTDLDGGGAHRAIRSLAAEARRRKGLFADYGGDIDVYEAARRHDPDLDLVKVPRLVIVVDEFAQLAQSHEDLMKDFINVAQVGRSLGMTMILATQRPTGIITGQIQSNTDLRMALRVAEVGDSLDVISSPIASTISKRNPGRAHIQTAAGLVEVQTAAVGIPRPGVVDRASVEAAPCPWVDAVRPPAEEERAEGDPTNTDLFAAVQLIEAAAVEGGYVVPDPPFQPPLADVITVDELGEPIPSAVGVPSLPIGLADLTEEQVQRPLMWHPATGSMVVAGSSQTGRSTVLRTLAAQVARWTSADDVHLHVLDMGGSLRALEDLPHCGAVVSRGQSARAARLVQRLEAELKSRIEVLERYGLGDLSELRMRGDGDRLPYITLLVDQWHALHERRTSGAGPIVEGVLRLARDGATAGISVVVAGDARSCATFAREISSALVLRQNAAHDVDAFGLRARDVPTTMVPGRALQGGTGTMVQVAVLDPDPSTGAQSDALAALIADVAAREAPPAGRAPFRVDELPASIDLATALDLPTAGPATGPVLVGVGGDVLSAHWYDPSVRAAGFTVCGPSGSGRTSALVVMARSAARHGVPVAVVAPGRSRLGGEEAALSVIGPAAEAPPIDDLVAHASAGGLVLVDDVESIADADALGAVLRAAEGKGALVVACTYDWARGARGLAGDLGRGRTGLLLTPQTTLSGAPLGISLRSDDLFAGPPGRALLTWSGVPVLVQVPDPAAGSPGVGGTG